jgi:hypothetical protein
VKFVLGFDAYEPMIAREDDVDQREHRKLVREADEAFEGGAAPCSRCRFFWD